MASVQQLPRPPSAVAVLGVACAGVSDEQASTRNAEAETLI